MLRHAPFFVRAQPIQAASKSLPDRARPPSALITRCSSRRSSCRSAAVTAAYGQPCLSTLPLIHFPIHRSLPLSISQSTYSSARSYLPFIRPVHVSRSGVLNHLSYMRNQTGHRGTLNNPAHKHNPQHKYHPNPETRHKSQPQPGSQALPVSAGQFSP